METQDPQLCQHLFVPRRIHLAAKHHQHLLPLAIRAAGLVHDGSRVERARNGGVVVQSRPPVRSAVILVRVRQRHHASLRVNGVAAREQQRGRLGLDERAAVAPARAGQVSLRRDLDPFGLRIPSPLLFLRSPLFLFLQPLGKLLILVHEACAAGRDPPRVRVSASILRLCRVRLLSRRRGRVPLRKLRGQLALGRRLRQRRREILVLFALQLVVRVALRQLRALAHVRIVLRRCRGPRDCGFSSISRWGSRFLQCPRR